MDQQTIAVLTILAALLPTIAVGALGFFLKRTLTALEAADKKNAADVKELGAKHDKEMKELRQEFNELKADMPLVYVTREDYIRVMTRVEDKLDQLLYGGRARKEE